MRIYVVASVNKQNRCAHGCLLGLKSLTILDAWYCLLLSSRKRTKTSSASNKVLYRSQSLWISFNIALHKFRNHSKSFGWAQACFNYWPREPYVVFMMFVIFSTFGEGSPSQSIRKHLALGNSFGIVGNHFGNNWNRREQSSNSIEILWLGSKLL